MTPKTKLLLTAALAITGLSSFAQPVGQWDFNSGTLAPTAGTAPLTYLDPNTQSGIAFGTTTSFGIPDIGGTVANVAKVNEWNTPSGIGMPVVSDANGGGSTVNQWTIIYDLLSPTASDGKWRALIETDNRVVEADADFFINPANGIGISGSYNGKIDPNTWYRVAFVVDNVALKIRKYINGTLVGIQDSDSVDGRWGLTAQGSAELFTDNDGDIAPLYVNSVSLWNRALSSGEIQALGGPTAAGVPQTIGAVPAFIESSSPELNAVNVSYLPAINVVLNSGSSTVPQSSLKLLLNGQEVAATIAPSGSSYTFDFQVTNPLDPGVSQTIGVVYSENGTLKTNNLAFTVENYQKITLPTPFLVENFDEVTEGEIPAGWTRTNRTNVDLPGVDLDSLRSDAYLDWTVVSKERLRGLKGGIFNMNTIVLNGTPIDPAEGLGSGNLLYAESDSRNGGNEVQMVFSKDFDLTGKKNVFIAFESLYEQNQDNINSFEYSIDGGVTWLPALYLIDSIDAGGDIIYNPDGSINVAGTGGTLTRVPGGSAYNLPYGAFIGAPVTEALAPYISPRLNDDDRESKRIEVIRLFQADNQPKVRLRFMQAGTGSWYWGIDNIGFYEIPEPRIVFGPKGKTVDYGANVSFTVTASGDPTLTYQWYQNGQPVANGTGATLTLNGVTGASSGDYTVKVSNSLGSATSAPANLNVLLKPVITTQPTAVLASAGAPISLKVVVGGQAPFNYQWSKGGTAINGATGAEYVVNAVSATDEGDYTVTISNASGSVTSTPVHVTVLPLIPITQDLVVHLPFDTDSNDTSGRGNNGTPEVQPEIENGVPPAPDGANKAIGAGSLNLKTGQHVALGNPEDLNFGTDVNFTFSFWVYGNSGAWTGDPSFIGNKAWTAGGNPGFVVAGQSSGTWKWNWAAPPGPRRDTAAFPTVTDGQWHNIVISHDRTGLAYFYLDGVLRGTQTIANDGDITALAHYIGQDGTGRYGFDTDLGARFVDVRLDDFGIWRRLLTPQEAASIYAHGKAGEDLTKASGQVVVLAPNITASPVSGIVSPGANVTLTATVSGTAPFTYQWKRGATVVGNSATLTLSSVDASASGDYTLTVSNSAGSVTSAPATILVSSAAIGDNLVAHIKFDGDYTDASGHNNNATPKGAPTLVAGKFGQAMQFTTDGATINYASFGKPADLNFGDATDFSVSMWVNWTASADDLPFISNKDWNSSDNTGWGVFSQGGGNLRIQATGTPSGSANKVSSSATPSIRDGNWHNVVTTFWRGKVAATYFDGVLVNTLRLTTTGSVDSGLDTNIGQDGTGTYTDGGGVHMTGKIDDVAIWRRALSAQEAARISAAAGDLSTLSASQLKITTFTVSGGQLHLNVTGAAAGAKLQTRANFDPGTQWQDVGPISGSADINVSTTGNAFYRVVNP